VLVAAVEAIGRRALAEVARRARMNEVPEETRRANPDGTTSYMRPLPGKARMYPETDVQPVRITREMVEGIEGALPKPFEEREPLKRLPAELAEKMMRSARVALFEKAVAGGCEPTFVATTLEETMKALARKGVETNRMGEERLLEFFSAYAKGVFARGAAPDILAFLAKHPQKGVAAAVKEMGLERISGKALEGAHRARGRGDGKDHGEVQAEGGGKGIAGDAEEEGMRGWNARRRTARLPPSFVRLCTGN